MDPKELSRRNGELAMTENPTFHTGEVLIPISSDETPKASNGFVIGSRSPEIRYSNSPNKPPKISSRTNTLTRKRSLTKTNSILSKDNSRFGQQPFPVEAIVNNISKEGVLLALQDQMNVNSPFRGGVSRVASRSSIRSNSMMTPRAPGTEPSGEKGEEEVDYERIYKHVKLKLSNGKRKRVQVQVSVQVISILFILGCLVASLTVDKVINYTIWGLAIWKWCVLVLVIFFGMLVTQWVMHFAVFLIEKNFMLRKKVLYFVYGLKKSVQVFVWLGCVLLTWVLLFKDGVIRSHPDTKILHYITWTLASFLIGAFLWLVKNLLLKFLASSFHVNRFFDRIQEALVHQHILQTLSGPPLFNDGEKIDRTPTSGHMSFTNSKKDKKVIDMSKVQRMKQEKVSAWNMKVLVDAVMNSRLSTVSNAVDESFYGGDEQVDKEITSEMEAIYAACDIFKNVTKPKTNPEYIEECDLLNFMINEEVDMVLPLIEAYETNPVQNDNEPRRISLKALAGWMVKVYQGRKMLAHALNDTKTAVGQLNKLVTGILIVIWIVIWLLLMEIATTKVLVFLSSQLLLAGFIFSNTCKTIFEAIIFVFVMHPFDVGDRCVIDGNVLMVEEMNILSTAFLKLDNTKIYYPNSILATKPIGNYYRSPDMGDTIEFSIDFTTTVEKIGLLKEHIKNYLGSNPLHWHPNHNVTVKEIQNLNMIKMGLYPNHMMNFQDYTERNRRRSALVMELKRIFEKLEIKYDLPPQKIHLHRLGSESTSLSN